MVMIMHAVLSKHCEFIAEGFMQGKLYQVKNYPGAILSNDAQEKVYGEVYQVKNREIVFEKLDEYETCSTNFVKPYEFVREKLKITLNNGTELTAWVYLYNWPVTELKQILSGDFLAS